MLSNELIREELSVAYLHAVAAKAGYSWESTRVDRDGIDGRVFARGRISDEAVFASPIIGFQLKETSSVQDFADPIHFKLKQKNYEDLRARSVHPRYLALLLLPNDPEDWLKLDINQMAMKRCMYWHSLAKAPPSPNETSTTVLVSRANLLDVRALQSLMHAASRGELV